MTLPAGFDRSADDRLIWSRDGAEMLPVAAGLFWMGAEPTDIFLPDECKPQREVDLEMFYIDRFPVTVAQYGRFIADEGYHREDLWGAEGWRWRVTRTIDAPSTWGLDPFNDPGQPVSGVSWFEACAYLTWVGKRLPSEAQWERAARGTDGRLFPWGDLQPNSRLANYGMQIGCPTPVGRYPEGASPVGCEEMAGNVNNWCLDSYASGERIDKGGGFATDPLRLEVLTCAGKTCWPAEDREAWHGFRGVVV